MGLLPGLALDVTTVNAKGEPWNFYEEEKQREAEALIDESEPWILIGSPMCTAFCTWQYLNAHKRDPELVAAERAKAVKHMEFVRRLYRKQVEAGRYFLHEHPAQATSWNLPCVSEVAALDGVATVVGD